MTVYAGRNPALQHAEARKEAQYGNTVESSYTDGTPPMAAD